MTDPNCLPLYIHCLDGCRITGLVIGCLRKLQCWAMPNILAEYTRYAEMEDGDQKLLKRYAGDFLFPDRPLPDWLWPGGRGWSGGGHHPTLRTRFEKDELMAAAAAEDIKAAIQARKEAFRARVLKDLLRDPVQVRQEREKAEEKAREERERQRGRMERVVLDGLVDALALHGLDMP
ncbi:MAG: hypothetical protein DHS80DRAFT_17124 [Piptocephalis tieghemiana]|nr:MAG: hypothetical protein DHS80DRAFT_17124 [Piptocephalis tieghemiana]